MKRSLITLPFLFILTFYSCNSPDLLFEKLDSDHTQVDFENKLVETVDANYFQHMYTYIGGGVAAADFNKDGLQDLFFVSNSFDNKLYLNKGDLQFEDISEKAGIHKRPGFDVGVAIADINSDGWPDIYITRGGWEDSDNAFANMLYINNGPKELADGSQIITFTEKASAFGLDDNNRGIAATFFDYDRDGDLDVYISNTPDFEDKDNEVFDLEEVKTSAKTLALKGSDKLYQNDGTGHFTDVSLTAGIMPDVGFGLNPQVGDLNQDGWLDIYVSNDFRIPDFVYINQKDGTFKDLRNESLSHMSFSSMGGDIADINNDGLMDVYTLDMNPEDYVRANTTMGMTSTYLFDMMVDKNYHHQYMHNMLQLNNGDGTFSEIANMSGVANTDWSWACLFSDFDLDGYNDICVTNGVFRDVIDRDANNDILSELKRRGRKPTDEDFLAFIKKLPQQKLSNYLFRNKQDLTFENVSEKWTESNPTFSNGATYADLDNDGDLEIIVSNLNDKATILKNKARELQKGDFLQIALEGSAANTQGIGAIVEVILENGQKQTRQLINSRGFLSSVSSLLHFGLAPNSKIARLKITWPDGLVQEKKDIQVNQVLQLKYADAHVPETKNVQKPQSVFTKIESPFRHVEKPYNDFADQLLLPSKLSQYGPALAKADLNHDGFDDLYLGGARDFPGRIILSDASGAFRVLPVPAFGEDQANEDVSATFLDVDSDGDLDLYVAAGSYEFPLNSNYLIGRLYLNDGKMNFTREFNKTPILPHAAGVVKAADYDKDGDVDLFVGSRVVPGMYPLTPTSFLLVNNGNAFQMETPTRAPDLEKVGMVTDAVWEDLDEDGDLDLIVTGEWMGIYVFENQNNKLVLSSKTDNLSQTKGWWNSVLVADVDGDGDKDIVAGNLGLNSKYKASPEKPFHVFANDYDYNGIVDVVLATYYGEKLVPVRNRVSLIQQIPVLGKQNPSFKEYAHKNLHELFGEDLDKATHLEAYEFRSGIFLNDGEEHFTFEPFENALQIAPINTILFDDFDKDGIKDLLMAGNNFLTETETTRNDAGRGFFLKGGSAGQFTYIKSLESGFIAPKDARKMLQIQTANGPAIVLANNNDSFDFYYLNLKK
ncbi:VCBS repeat-containing protein [Marinilongibacter aquaticus]|uniref:VCBS repeat-containing protein n=1 Tax=Marinilongibacter aquaticus TaxID=2975157 RepID=UPI0021BDE604|nr:VCBS repeat-containing protein [Marinilongibacter aquaticus]UBM59345.1 VCBS repeat-containing protein [Marinilongibacter aquaticus]